MKLLHIGCGKNYINGWINADINESVKADIYFDAEKFIPFKDLSLDCIYSEHFLEHLSLKSGAYFLSECYRILKKGGNIRISTPNLETIVRRYLSREFIRIDGWRPASLCDMVNEAMRLWGHKYIYDFDKLECVLQAVGFVNIASFGYQKSNIVVYNDIESRPYNGELIVGATK